MFKNEIIAKCAFFFFQAEDGIRARNVTGVQTCALPIWGARDRAGGPATADAGGCRGDPGRGMGPGDDRRIGSARGLAYTRRERGGQRAAAAAGSDGLGAPALAISLG